MLSLLETLSLSCRRLALEDMQIEARIGAHDDERNQAQPIVVNIDVWVPLRFSTAARDRLDEVYSYSVLPQIVRNVVAEGHIDLQETLGDRILERLLADERVAAVRVKTSKVRAYPDAKAVSVETFHCRTSFIHD